MEVEIALKGLMRRYGIREHGSVTQLARLLKVKRQAASKIVNGKVASISYEHMGQICEWLLNSVDPSKRKQLRRELPGSLFRFAGPWARLLDAESLTVFLGERIFYARPGATNGTTNRWISGTDSEVASNIVHRLTNDGGRFEFVSKTVPFHFPDDATEIDEEHLRKDQQAAVDLFEDLRGSATGATLLIGSQRVNFLVEAVVAELHGCEPFERNQSQCEVPFYMQYRENDPALPTSCFGGSVPPPDHDGEGGPGIYYRGSAGGWIRLPWIEDRRDAGVVVLVEDAQRAAAEREPQSDPDPRQPAPSHLTVVLFGFSGSGTWELAKIFCNNPDKFWPLSGTGDRRSGVFVCRLDVDEADGGSQVIALQQPEPDR